MTAPGKKLLKPWLEAFLKEALAVSAVAFIAALWFVPERALSDLLVANFYFTSLALGAVVFVAVQHVAGAGWSVLLRRIPEAAAAYLPAGAALCGVVFLGAGRLYPWAAAGASAATIKWGYLTLPWALGRAAVYWSLWIVLSRRVIRHSDDPERARPASAAFLVVFAITFSLAVVDWLMSLEPRWYSTIYPWLLFGGAFECGLAALAIVLVVLKARGELAHVNEHHMHDLGKYLFAFSTFWAYLWFSQYLLIWYSNLPEETSHFINRLTDGWAPLFWLNPIVNFAAPFALLLPASRKKKAGVLAAAAALLLAGHWLDIYLLVAPSGIGPHPRVGVLELIIFAGPAALFLLLFDRALAGAPAVPERDPYLIESVHFEGI